MRTFQAIAIGVMTLAPLSSACAQDSNARALRFGTTSGAPFDGRSSDCDLPTNGYFPGSFASNPASFEIGSVGFFSPPPRQPCHPDRRSMRRTRS